MLDEASFYRNLLFLNVECFSLGYLPKEQGCCKQQTV